MTGKQPRQTGAVVSETALQRLKILAAGQGLAGVVLAACRPSVNSSFALPRCLRPRPGAEPARAESDPLEKLYDQFFYWQGRLRGCRPAFL